MQEKEKTWFAENIKNYSRLDQKSKLFIVVLLHRYPDEVKQFLKQGQVVRTTRITQQVFAIPSEDLWLVEENDELVITEFEDIVDTLPKDEGESEISWEDL